MFKKRFPPREEEHEDEFSEAEERRLKQHRDRKKKYREHMPEAPDTPTNSDPGGDSPAKEKAWSSDWIRDASREHSRDVEEHKRLTNE